MLHVMEGDLFSLSNFEFRVGIEACQAARYCLARHNGADALRCACKEHTIKRHVSFLYAYIKDADVRDKNTRLKVIQSFSRNVERRMASTESPRKKRGEVLCATV